MVSKTKANLKTEIDATIYENLSGAITPTTHNPLLTNVNDSVVNELEPKVQADLDIQDNSINNVTSLNLNITPTVPWAEGKVFWDEQNKTLSFYNDSSDVVVQVGQEQVFKVRNISGETISDGEAVRITGSQGNLLTIAKAQANTTENARVIGVVTQANITNNSSGYITLSGLVRGLNTNAFTDGDVLYLSDSIAGGFTTTPLDIQSRIGVVVYAHQEQGKIFVNLSNNEINSTDIVPEGNSNLYYTEARVTANTSVQANSAKVSADGSVVSHSDINDAGSGAIITTSERNNLHTHSNKAVIDAISNAGSGAIITSGERTNLHTHSNKTILDNTTASFTTADKSNIDTNTAKVSASGSVGTHSDVDLTSAGDSKVMVWRTNKFVMENQAGGGAGSGDVTGPASSTADNLTTFLDTTGKAIKDSGVSISAVNANTAKVSADGSVTSHSDVTSAGSGAIITSGERIQISTNNTQRAIISSDDTLVGQMELAVLTQAQYDGLTPDSNTVYFISG